MSTQYEREFQNLDIDGVLDACEAAGFEPDGFALQLNSFENRVYLCQVGEGSRIVTKFYRPHRYSHGAILEEHGALEELVRQQVPVVAPLKLRDNTTLLQWEGFWVGFFPAARGRLPDEIRPEDYFSLGVLLAHMHRGLATNECLHRPVYSASEATENLDIILECMPPDYRYRYEQAALRLIEAYEESFPKENFLPIHGDWHRGNLLVDERLEGLERFLVMDFDDFGLGPRAQDFLHLPTEPEELDQMLSGYNTILDWDGSELQELSLVRAYRILHYSAWVWRRWYDPIFPKVFPQYEESNHWAAETDALEGLFLR